MGRYSSVVMVNSRWTQAHIVNLWRHRQPITVVYPPCDTVSLQALDLDLGEREDTSNALLRSRLSICS